MSPSPQRLPFIDATRTYAVLLVLLAHALNATGVFTALGSDSRYIQQFTRQSTPLFVFIFGFMLEFVYARKAKDRGIASVRPRLVARSLQCYAAYVLTSLSTFLGGHGSWTDFLSSLIFCSNAQFGNILRVYAVLLLTAPWLINLRLRLGPVFLLGGMLMVLLSSRLLLALKGTSFGALDFPLNLLLGIGPVSGGPSIWHSQCFLLAGMFVATGLTDNRDAPLAGLYRALALLLVVMSVSGLLLITDPLPVAWEKFVDFTYRSKNMAGYYIIGTLCSTVTLSGLALSIGTRPLPYPVTCLLPLGQSSLFAYTFGNVVLNLFAPLTTKIPLPVFLPSFFCLVLIGTVLAQRLPFGKRNAKLPAGPDPGLRFAPSRHGGNVQ